MLIHLLELCYWQNPSTASVLLEKKEKIMEPSTAFAAYIYTAAKRAVQGKADPARAPELILKKSSEALGVPEQVPERLPDGSLHLVPVETHGGSVPVPREHGAEFRTEELVERDAETD